MYTFKKEERLCNKKLIEQLYHNGSSFLCYPYKVSWILTTDADNTPVKVVFSVPKKRFKNSVDRNQIKRRMREAFRLNKQDTLYTYLIAENKSIALSLGYVAKDIIPFDVVQKKMVKLLGQLCVEIAKWKRL